MDILRKSLLIIKIWCFEKKRCVIKEIYESAKIFIVFYLFMKKKNLRRFNLSQRNFNYFRTRLETLLRLLVKKNAENGKKIEIFEENVKKY